MHQYGYGGSPFTAGASNPEVVRGHIAQDLGYYGQMPTQTSYQPMQNFSQQSAGTLGQFGTNPQAVRQHISQDQGYGMTQTTGFQSIPGYQPIQNQAYYNPSVFQQVMSHSPTEAEWVRQQIQQDIQAGAQPPAYLNHSQGQMHQTYGTTGMLSQFGTHPQVVQNHIRQDLNQGQYQSTGYQNQYGGNSMLSQYGSNPQMVQSHIQNDLGRTGYTQPTAPYGYQNHATGAFSQFGTNPQLVQSQIRNDLGVRGF